MIVKPKMRGFICTTAHPEGCAANVREQVAYVQGQKPIDGPKRVLVVGSSTGYGLASRIAASFGCGAESVGIYFEKPGSGNRTASAGWYNNQAFEQEAQAAGLTAVGINGDAYSKEVKEQAIQAIREQLSGGQVDMVIYSLASPRRTDPETGETYSSVIKPLGQAFSGRTVDFHTGVVSDVTIEPATQEEKEGTVAVMGGEDWLLWMQALKGAGVLAPGCCTVAYSYLGPVITHAIYKDGTIGKAKEDLEEKCRAIDQMLASFEGKAFVSVNKALVTQSSSAIPVVPLYISLLFKVMKEKGTHEDCIQQMYRMLERLFAQEPGDWEAVSVDEAHRIRLDDWEMEPGVQDEVARLWGEITTENLAEHTDIAGYRSDFYRLFGFGRTELDYEKDTEV
ncbi:enoyl-ACP reductase FabV [Oscillospiraceae bacterium MB08-C2-2]|nr:enoyl-ACP reductase FabV [Oscillospiraceae bacterium MB08-C2-2]